MDNDDLDMSECVGSNILAAKDLEDGKVYTATILKVFKHQFEDGIKPVILTDYMGKKIVLNPTRAKAFVAAWGLNGKNWVGRMFQFWLGIAFFQGAKVGSIEVAPVITAAVAAPAERKAIETKASAPGSAAKTIEARPVSKDGPPPPPPAIDDDPALVPEGVVVVDSIEEIIG
jgi:hypothetical protein